MRQSKAIRKIKEKASQGDIKSAFQLYEYYQGGKYVEKDHEIADKYANKVLALFKDHSLKILNIKLTDFRLFQKIECHFSSEQNLTVIVGINGVGKTTILEAIALSFSWLTVNIKRHGGKGKSINDKNDIRRGETYASIITQLSINSENTPYELELSKSVDASENASRKNSLMEIRQLGRIYKLANAKDKNCNLPIITYYPVERSLDINIKELETSSKKITEQTNKFDGYNESLSGTANANIKEFFQWFKYCEEIEKFETGSIQEQASRFIDETKKAIEVFIPYIENMRIQRTPYEDMLIDKEGITLSILQLSQGEKSLLALVADIIRRLVLLNPSLENPLYGNGVILIDEVDLHLHPSWQQKVVPALLRTFPNIQFILTTHSPQVLTTVKSENIQGLVYESGNLEIRKFDFSLGAKSHELLNNILGVNERPENLAIVKKLNKYLKLIDDNLYNTKEAKSLRKELDLWGRGKEKDLMKADMDIRLKEYQRKKYEKNTEI